MCGRYTLTVDPAELREMLELGELPPNLQPRYNIAPTQAVPVVTSAQDRKVEMFQWGLIPSWSKDPSMSGRMINARAESLRQVRQDGLQGRENVHGATPIIRAVCCTS